MSRDLFHLIHRGYFPKELPPCFNTYTFAILSTTLHRDLEEGWDTKRVASLTECSIPKNGIGRRYVHLVHPLKYYFLAKRIVECYGEIKRLCDKSPFSRSSPQLNDDINQRRAIPESKSVAAFRTERINRSFDHYFEMKVDISNFYPSIYTHTIPWAFTSKGIGKRIWHSRTKKTGEVFDGEETRLYDIGHNLDALIQRGQDKQTHGIPVGPDVSFILAETLLSHLDTLIANRCPEVTGCRYYDDYYLYFDTREEAEKTLRVMIDLFNQFGLEINLSKVSIKPMPTPVTDNYALKLSPYNFGKSIGHNALTIYFDVLWGLVNESPQQSTTIIRYGLKVLQAHISDLKAEDEKTLSIFLLKAIVLNPAVTPEVLKMLNGLRQSPDKSVIDRTANAVMRRHIAMGHHLETLWAIWICKKYNIELSAPTVLSILEIDNPLCTLMSLDYLHNTAPQLLTDNEIKNKLTALSDSMTTASLYDRNWMLLYEGCSKGWIKRSELIDNDDFFKLLKDNKVSFYDTDNEADYNDVEYIGHKPLKMPQFAIDEARPKSKQLLNEIRDEAISRYNDKKDERDPWDDSEYDIEDDVDNNIEEQSIATLLLEEITRLLFSGEDYNEDDIVDRYAQMLLSLKKY